MALYLGNSNKLNVVLDNTKYRLNLFTHPIVCPESYLTFASAEPFTVGVNDASKQWNGVLYYSTDTETWNEWDGTSAITSAEHDGEQKIYMAGSGNTRIMHNSGSFNTYNWVLTGSNIRCIGNIETLLDYETVANGEHPVMQFGCYNRMFYGCTSLITAPELPAVTLSESCYESMFQKSGITEAPALPATTLTNRCYYRMFSDCNSLVTIPSLPALEMKNECYMRMFNNCTNLKLSKTPSDEYPYEYRIPTSGNGTKADALSPMYNTFYKTGGTFTGSPSINTTYYTANEVVPPGKPVAFLYNGVRLPKLPEWDREKYLYVYLINKTLFNRHYFAALSAVNFFTDKDGYWSIATYPKTLQCYFDTKSGEFSEWSEVEKEDETDGVSVSSIGWANFDVLNEDGTVYLEASEPMPVYE